MDRMRSRQDWEEEQKKKYEDEQRTKGALAALGARAQALGRMGCKSTSAGPSGITLYFDQATHFRLEQQLDAFKVNIIKWCGERRIPTIRIWVEFPGQEREEY